MRRARSCFVLVLLPSVLPAAEPPSDLPGVVVVGERAIVGTPAAVDRIDVDAVPAREQRSISEVLRRVPGVAARDRQNLAQDLQLAIRGYGARSTFGVRGLRLYADGIPATMPDGQGQVSHVPLGALARVEVLRGPFSALYGNASGGVIEFFSAAPASRNTFGVHAAAGTDATWRESLWWSGPWHAARDRDDGYRVDAERLRTRGHRDHSAARRDIAQARWLVDSADGRRRVALTANGLDLDADDPQGLSREQALRSPRVASAGALAFDTRKRVRQRQLGIRVEQGFGSRQRLILSTWTGTRDTFQVLSVPVAAQANPASGGGVVDLAREYGGLDLRWRADGTVFGRAASITIGAELQRSTEHRRGFENFVGTQLGVVGLLRRDERDRVSNQDVFAEARWQLQPHWNVTVGVRHSRVGFRTRDAYVAPGNPDDSGRLRYARPTPVAGVLFRPRDGLELFGNVGRGFETPAFSELAYRSDGTSGLNEALRPSRSGNAEVGMRLLGGARTLALTAFESRTRDELVVAGNVGGRSTYANAARTRRRGWELAMAGPLASRWRYALAITSIDARYRDAFASCRAAPCVQPDTQVAAGNRMPGIASSAWAELRWTPRANLDLFVQANAMGRTWADDANASAAPGYATLDLGAERRWQIGVLELDAFARLDNVADRQAIGSVIVNESNGRYFEPAPGRGWMVGISVAPAARP